MSKYPSEGGERFWLTPPDLMSKLDDEFSFDFDACPYPRAEDYNSLTIPWGKSTYVNPPFHPENGVGPTAFVRKAISENQKGKQIVLVAPVQSYINLMLEAGAELRSLGRVKWLSCETGQPTKQPSPICCFILKKS